MWEWFGKRVDDMTEIEYQQRAAVMRAHAEHAKKKGQS